jgi:hypothetical protein
MVSWLVFLSDFWVFRWGEVLCLMIFYEIFFGVSDFIGLLGNNDLMDYTFYVSWKIHFVLDGCVESFKYIFNDFLNKIYKKLKSSKKLTENITSFSYLYVWLLKSYEKKAWKLRNTQRINRAFSENIKRKNHRNNSISCPTEIQLCKLICYKIHYLPSRQRNFDNYN